jgi:hypothetical protein
MNEEDQLGLTCSKLKLIMTLPFVLSLKRQRFEQP